MKNNPLFSYNRYYNLKYLSFNYPTHLKYICHMWADRRLIAHPSVAVVLEYRRVLLVFTNNYYPKSNTSLSKVMWLNAIVLWLSRFFTHITGIPNSSNHIHQRLTYPTQRVNSHLQLLLAITCPHFISLKGLNQNPPWHNNHISQYRPFSFQWPIDSYTTN